MKRINLLVMILVTAIFINACGTSTPSATEVSVPQSSEQSTAANGTEVTITLEDNNITSSLTEFQVGVPYKFVITNAGSHGHNFNIAQPASVVGSLNAALQGALLAVPRNQLGAGAQVTVEYTFPTSATSTQLEFSCLITRHYEDGMFLAITVTN